MTMAYDYDYDCPEEMRSKEVKIIFLTMAYDYDGDAII